MRPFWDHLNRGVNTKGGAHFNALIDAEVEQPDQLAFNTFEEKSPTRSFAHLATRVDEVDSEGFTSQDAGHVAHEQYDVTRNDDLG